MADQDPFAAAGFAPVGTPPSGGIPASAAADPFAAAGFAPAPKATPDADKMIGQPLMVDPVTGMPTYSDAASNAAMTEGLERVGEKGAEGATFGTLPLLVGAARTLGGTPFKQGVQDARDYTAETSRQAPGVSMLAEGAGSVIPTALTMGALNPAIAAAGRAVPYAGTALAQALTGAGLGAASSAGHDVGSGGTQSLGADTMRGALTGGVVGGAAPVLGAAVQAAPNMIRGGAAALQNIGTGPGRDAVAGQIAREVSGDFANSAAQSPVPGMTLRTAQATGNPGIAALDRTLASEPGTTAANAGNIVQNGRTPNQMGALAQSLVGADAGIEPSVLTNQASAQGVQALQTSRDVLRQAENDLWEAPELNGVRLHPAPLVAGVQQDVARMTPSFRMAIGQGPLAALMGDIQAIPEGASIADVNAVRSRILEQARASRAAGDNVSASAAQQLGDSVLNRTEGALGNAGAAVQDAYATARDFTRQRAQAFGYPEFDQIFRPNAAGNMRANPEAAFGRFFDLPGGTGSGLQRLQGVSNLLQATGQPEALDAANGLQTAAQNYVRAGVLKQARAGAGLDPTGAPVTNPATLAATINRAVPAVGSVPMTAPIAGGLQASGNAAELLNRPSTLRGDANSTTYEKLRNRDLVSAIIGQSGSSALGGAAGGYMAAEHGPESVPWYLRVPGGVLAGALMGQRAGPYLTHVPYVGGALKAMASGPSADIQRRLAAGLADPAEWQRLMAAQMATGPTLTAPGLASNAIQGAAQAAIPTLTRGSAP